MSGSLSRFLFAFSFLIASPAILAENVLEGFYQDFREAQDTGKYPELLNKLAKKKGLQEQARSQIIENLEALKGMSAAQRDAAFKEILFHWSKSNDVHKATPLALDKNAGLTVNQLIQGNYESSQVADNLIARVEEYERQVSIPVYDQVRTEIAKEFADRDVLFLGRDFTPAQVWMANRIPKERDRYHMLNVSRAIKDEVEEHGKVKQMKALLEQAGLTKKRLLKQGLVFVDSSMAGKIPAAILKAAVSDMDGQEAYQFLKNVDVRYLKSSRKEGQPVSEAAEAMAQGGKLTQANLGKILERLEGIGEFKVTLPEPVKNYKGDKHHLAEHRPKVLSTTTGFEKTPYGVGLVSEVPKDPGNKIKSLLGLVADLTLVTTAQETGTVEQTKVYDPKKVSSAKEPAKEEKKKADHAELKSPLPQKVEAEIDKAAKGGREKLREWQDVVTKEMHQRFAEMQVRKTNNKEFPFEFVVTGKNPKTIRLRKILGEGNNVTAYLTEHGTALKVVKEAEVARKNLLLAWSDKLMKEYDIPAPRVVDVDPTGVFLEQELVPGENLEYLFGHSQKGMPKGVKDQVLQVWENASRLAKEKDVWLDIKAANFHMGDKGDIRFVDVVPRLNSSYFRFYGPSAGKKFSEEQFLQQFLYHELKGSTYTKAPKDPENGWKRWKEIEGEEKAEPAAKPKTPPKAEIAEVKQLENAAGIQLKAGQRFRLNHGTYTVVSEVKEAGEDRRVYKVQGEDGRFYVFKHARTNKAEDVGGITKEKTRYGDIAEIGGIRQAEMIEEGNDWLLREWITGFEGDKWLKQWEKDGYPQDHPAWANLRAMLMRSAEANKYIGKIDPEDILWDPASGEWVIVDSGGVSDRPQKDSIRRYIEKLGPRWAEVVSDPKRCLREITKLGKE
jgi:hypothetical protein